MEENQKGPEAIENKKEENVNKTEEEKTLEKPKGEGRKFPTLKKSIEDVIKKVVKTKKMFKFIKKKIPNKLDAEQRLKTMRMNSMRPKKERGENDFENLTIKDRSATVAERISQYELEMKRLDEEKRMIVEERKIR